MAQQTGVAIDAHLVASRLGPPVEVEMANWFPGELVPQMTEQYRQLHAVHGVPTTLLPQGPRDACESVLDDGGRVVVVTAKKPERARMVIDYLDLPVHALHAGLWGGGKPRPCSRNARTCTSGITRPTSRRPAQPERSPSVLRAPGRSCRPRPT